MPEQFAVYRVFLSSPSDVEDERRAALRVQNRINALFALPRRRILHVSMWEDVTPKYGRAQGQLNPLVDDCDLFVGLLHKRWGTPTGEFTSGFEEEFTLARDRRDATGSPEIAMFFKALTDDERANPDDDLQRVLGFKKGVSSILGYRSVNTTEEWEKELGMLLTEFVIGEYDTAPSTEAAVAAARASGVGMRAHDDNAVRAELAAAINALAEPEKIILTLVYYEGLTIEQVALILGVDVAEATSLREGALRQLKDKLMPGGGPEVRELWRQLNEE